METDSKNRNSDIDSDIYNMTKGFVYFTDTKSKSTKPENAEGSKKSLLLITDPEDAEKYIQKHVELSMLAVKKRYKRALLSEESTIDDEILSQKRHYELQREDQENSYLERIVAMVAVEYFENQIKGSSSQKPEPSKQASSALTKSPIRADADSVLSAIKSEHKEIIASVPKKHYEAVTTVEISYYQKQLEKISVGDEPPLHNVVNYLNVIDYLEAELAKLKKSKITDPARAEMLDKRKKTE